MASRNSSEFYKEMYLWKRIVIIGAGISGLACAIRLREIGFRNVKILEARSRVGGRINSIELDSNVLEMGAQWIHGEVNNVIYQFSKSFQLTKTNTFSYMNAVTSLTTLTEKEREAFIELFEFLDEKIKHISEKLNTGVSLSNYLDDQFHFFLSNHHHDLHNFFQEVYDWYCNFLLEINGCESLSLLSVNLLDNYKECAGDPHIELKKGYSSVLDILLSLISFDWILTNKSVVKIDWSDFVGFEECNFLDDFNSVKVICEDGTLFKADHVIITIPLGCLKKYYQSLFSPSLCNSKEAAIQSLGFGTVNKIYLHFQEPFWKGPAVFLVFNHHFLDKKLLKVDFNKCKASLRHWVKYINRFSYTLDSPNVLCAWIAGEGAVLMESLSEDEVISDCMKLLENILEKKLPFPYKMSRSTWYSDPYAHGSYSYLSVNCERKGLLQTDLAKPEYASSYFFKYPVLMFAGEATHECYYSTVHGAYETGVREADRLFHYYSGPHIAGIKDVFETLPLRLNEMLLNKKNLSKEFHVAIVGAGIAGLSCAFHLANNNFRNITIVDALDRIGGRVLTAEYGGCLLELGAQWIHGTNNVLYDFSNIHNLLPHIQEVSYEGKGLFYTSDGEVIENTLVEEVGKIVNDAKLKIDNGNYDKNTTKSVKTFLTEAFHRYVDKDDKLNLSLKEDLLNWYIKFEVIDNACDDLNDIALQSFTEWDDCSEDFYHINFKEGFQSVPYALLSKIPDINLHLNTPVQTIKWNENFKYQNTNFQNRLDDNFPVLLQCKNKSIYADCVIVTASIGFLKENIDSFFTPTLPSKKLAAIRKIGFGTVNKIFLIYEKPFWSSKDLGFHFVWTTNGLSKCERLCNENPWIYGITGFDVVPKYPNVLLGWIGGKEAKLMEKIKSESVKNVCTEMLRIFLNDSNIPFPLKIIRSNWYSNPYIQGSYSYRTPSFYENKTTLQDLQQPLCCRIITSDKDVQWPIVIFSGEATDEHSFSSAHGAYNSGLTAAENLVTRLLEIQGIQ